jgi:hypothetical protein
MSATHNRLMGVPAAAREVRWRCSCAGQQYTCASFTPRLNPARVANTHTHTHTHARMTCPGPPQRGHWHRACWWARAPPQRGHRLRAYLETQDRPTHSTTLPALKCEVEGEGGSVRVTTVFVFKPLAGVLTPCPPPPREHHHSPPPIIHVENVKQKTWGGEGAPLTTTRNPSNSIDGVEAAVVEW